MKRLFSIPILTILALFVLTGSAFADVVQNDVVIGGNDTIEAGDSTTINYSLLPSNTLPAGDASGCNATGADPATVTLSLPAGVTASGGVNFNFVGCGNLVPKTFSSNIPGDYTINITSISGGKAGSLWQTSSATFVLHVVAPPPSDTTAPHISYVLNPSSPDGANGWYKSNVTLTWTVTENESASSLVKTGCVNQNITADQGPTNYSCSATSDGGSAGPVTVTIKRDATKPTVSAAVSAGTAGLNGWYTSNVTVGFTCADAGSGVASCPSNQILSTEGSSVSTTAQMATDNAGNVSNPSNIVTVKIDKTSPIVAVTGVADDATYTLGSVPAAGCSTTDSFSGVSTNAVLSTTGGPVGTITSTCTGGKDNAGNVRPPVSVTYQVIYNWTGFFSPVDNLPALNSVKAGGAVPVKFSLAGNQGLAIFKSGSPSSTQMGCTGSVLPILEDETVTAGGSSLTYDSTANQYVYVWKTDKNWAGTCRQLIVKLIDGTEHKANFQFK